MLKFLSGVIIGILISFLFFYFGGGKTVKKVGEGLSETGKKMEVLEETFKKGKDDLGKIVPKKSPKEEREIPKKGQ